MKHLLSYIFTFFNTNRPLLFISSILLASATGLWVSSANPQTINFFLQDFAFIATYVIAALFFIMIFQKEITLSPWANIFSWITIITGISDTIENVLSILCISGTIQSDHLIQYFTFVKYGGVILFLAYALFLIIKLIVYILKNWQQFFESIHVAPAGYVLKSLKMYLPGLITVIFSYFIFIQITIGQDIIVQITEHWGPFIWSLICIPLWSILCWYSSRLVGYEKLLQPGSGIPEEFHSHMPRLIAYNALVSIQAAIIALPTIGNLTEGGVWAFIIIQNLLYYFWHRINNSSRAPYGYIGLSSFIAAAYVSAMIYLIFIGHYTHQKLLPVGALVLFVFQMILARQFINRRKSIGETQNSMMSVSFIGLSELSKWVRVPGNVRDKEQPLFRKIFMVAIGALLLFICANIFPYLADHMGPLPLVLLGLTVIVVLANISTILSIHKGINVFVVVLIWAFIMGKIYDPYKVRTVHSDPVKVQRPMMKDYVKNWIDKRKCMIDSVDTFPVYLVIADGGASRSGYWVASVLSKLEEISDTTAHDGNTFSDHLMVLAGASGGSLGNATFYALLKQDADCNATSKTYYLTQSRAFLKQDFISPVISHWLGADMANHLLPFHFDDRAAALEKSMEYHGHIPMQDAFAKPFSEVMDTSGRLPIFFINTTNVQQGQPAVISTIDINSFSNRIDVLDLAVSVDPGTISDIRYSTAVVMGARFPYVSPAGNLGNRSFVDGGYFDNTGAGILHEMLQELRGRYKGDSLGFDRKIFEKLKFQLIYISNGSLKTSDPEPMAPLINDFSAPIVTVLGTYGSQTTVNNLRLQNFMKDFSPGVESVEINLYKDKDELDFPLNWVISDYNLERMDSNLEIQTRKLKLLPIQRKSNAQCNCIPK
jgi:hypothetical protein